MEKRFISSGSEYEAKIGYSRAVVAGGWVFVAGTTGSDPQTGAMPESVVEQCENTIGTISRALAEAGASLDDVVRVNYVLPVAEDFEACWPILSKAFAKAKPAAMMIVAGLISPQMKIEIEVTALLPKA
ncbi:RidA family protein [Alphaproteobacteria bacterium KMM 3653]|uniref:RidA family protein n=1 Tax=Harenicola maris TaxID=2841044 RepID=A0AAP2CKP4_9RHOB|nr:RidA family protein [Harenicola maris]